jgi:antitoxin HigA-1
LSACKRTRAEGPSEPAWEPLEFLEPLGLSQNRLASDIGVPARRMNEIVLRKRRVSADTALRLGRYSDTTPQFWLGLQTDYGVDVVSDELGDQLDREVRTPTEGSAAERMAAGRLPTHHAATKSSRVRVISDPSELSDSSRISKPLRLS